MAQGGTGCYITESEAEGAVMYGLYNAWNANFLSASPFFIDTTIPHVGIP